MVSSVLRRQWEQFGGSTGRAEAVLDDIVASYSDPARRYHNLAHVVGVVERVNELSAQPLWDDQQHASTDLRIAVLAAWYHDVVYVPGRNDNEEQSAVRAERELPALLSEAHDVRQIAALVRMTAHHEPTSPAGRLLADADLWTLGGPNDEYRAYGELIRAEFAHVPEPAWKAGRAAFISMFLARQNIFSTPRGRVEREANARRNLLAELHSLR